MNAVCKSLVVVAATGLLAACATMPRANPAAVSKQGADGRYSVDQQYVEAVERASRAAGVRVVWINPPRKADRDD